MNEALAGEVWSRLERGRSLEDLGLGRYQGRIDLRGIAAPQASRREGAPHRVGSLEAVEVTGVPWLEDVRLEGIDFSNASLGGMALMRAEIVDCRFDEAKCSNWGLWGTTVVDSSFRAAVLRESSLGPPPSPKLTLSRGMRRSRSTYTRVDFSEADLRGAHALTGMFVDCNFSRARLDKVDFGFSYLVRCQFAGDLTDVEFSAADERGSAAETLEDVDFSDAELRFVAFRRLNLDRVKLPTSPNHIIVRRYRCVIDRALAELNDGTRSSLADLRGLLKFDREWLGPTRDIGIFHLSMFDDPAAAVELLRRIETECARS
jgi:uncharacterized protein YjbI with pentapeptide repeats